MLMLCCATLCCAVHAAADKRPTFSTTTANHIASQQAGLDEATKQLRSYPSCVDGDPSTTESRIIVLTGGWVGG